VEGGQAAQHLGAQHAARLKFLLAYPAGMLAQGDINPLVQQAGLERIETLAYVYADIGAGQFYAGAIEVYAPLVVRAGLLRAEQVEMWLREQRRTQAEGTAFRACNHYTYIAR